MIDTSIISTSLTGYYLADEFVPAMNTPRPPTFSRAQRRAEASKIRRADRKRKRHG